MFTLPSSKWKKHSQTGPPVKPELMSEQGLLYLEGQAKRHALRLHGMSWGVKTTCFKAPEVSLGGSGVSIGGVRSLRVWATVRKHSALLSMILYHAFCGKMTGSLYFMVVFKKILIYSFGLIFHLLYTIQPTKGPFCHCSNCLWLIHQREMQTNATIPTDWPSQFKSNGKHRLEKNATCQVIINEMVYDYKSNKTHPNPFQKWKCANCWFKLVVSTHLKHISQIG